jgi:hypothetical protein
MANKCIYKVMFINQGKVYEIYAKHISQSNLYGFLEVEGLTFGDRSTVVIDPSEERLQSEFEGVSRTYIPIHAVIRVDEVQKQGVAKIKDLEGGGQVTPFPGSPYGTGGGPKSD